MLKINRKFFSRNVLVIIILVVSVGIATAIILTARRQIWVKTHVDISDYPKNMPEAQVEELSVRLRSLLMKEEGVKEDASIDAVVREGSYSETTNGEITTAKFLVDVDYVKQSYAVTINWSSAVEDLSEVTIGCTSRSQSKYPNSFCETTTDTTDDIEWSRDNPIFDELPIIVNEIDGSTGRTINYEIRSITKENGARAIVIVDFCGGLEARAREKLLSFGYDLNGCEIEYLDESGVE